MNVQQANTVEHEILNAAYATVRGDVRVRFRQPGGGSTGLFAGFLCMGQCVGRVVGVPHPKFSHKKRVFFLGGQGRKLYTSQRPCHSRSSVKLPPLNCRSMRGIHGPPGRVRGGLESSQGENEGTCRTPLVAELPKLQYTVAMPAPMTHESEFCK